MIRFDEQAGVFEVYSDAEGTKWLGAYDDRASARQALAKWTEEEGWAEVVAQEEAAQINDLEVMRDEIIGDAGRYWHACEFTQATLAQIDAQIAKIKGKALPPQPLDEFDEMPF